MSYQAAIHENKNSFDHWGATEEWYQDMGCTAFLSLWLFVSAKLLRRRIGKWIAIPYRQGVVVHLIAVSQDMKIIYKS